MTPPSGTQRFIVDIPAGIARRALAIASADRGYENLSELIAAALENQLTLEYADTAATMDPTPSASNSNRATERPKTHVIGAASSSSSRSDTLPASRSAAPGATSALPELDEGGASIQRLLTIPNPDETTVRPEPLQTDGSLSVFTNRLNPLVVPVRVLANLAAHQDEVLVDELVAKAPAAARVVGQRLKAEDEEQGRRGRDKRSTGWPIGQDEVTSIGRFRKSFFFSVDNGVAAGPLVDLGLLVVTDGRVELTGPGMEVAADKNPVLDGAGDGLLSSRQQELLRKGLLRMRGECSELVVFLAAVRTGQGVQSHVDRKIAEAHPSWTDAQVVSHRAAMIGRLRDVGVLDVSNPAPGQEIEIYLQPAGAEFEAALGSMR